MSLKAFHILFITLSVLLCIGVAGWNYAAYVAAGGVGNLAQTIGWSVAAAGLLVYGILFLRKYKALRYI